MKEVFIAITINLPSLASVIGAIMLAINGKEGWGWFLFVAILLFHTLGEATK